MRPRRHLLLAVCVLFLAPVAADAQATGQVWGEFMVDRVKNNHLTYELDLEPKALVSAPSGQPGWWTIDVTPKVDWVARNWLDLTGEVSTAYTRQTNEVDSLELTERFGLRFHLFSRHLPAHIEDRLRGSERPAKGRLVLRDYVRIEQRNLFYTSTKPDSSTWRLRNRLEFEFPLNRPKVSADGAVYLTSDWEWFIPLNGDASERFANKQRVRAGLGYRRDLHWRLEALYVWGRSRNTMDEPFTTNEHIIDVRVKRVF